MSYILLVDLVMYRHTEKGSKLSYMYLHRGGAGLMGLLHSIHNGRLGHYRHM